MEVTALDGAGKTWTDFVITKFPNSLLLGITFTGDHCSRFLAGEKKQSALLTERTAVPLDKADTNVGRCCG